MRGIAAIAVAASLAACDSPRPPERAPDLIGVVQGFAPGQGSMTIVDVEIQSASPNPFPTAQPGRGGPAVHAFVFLAADALLLRRDQREADRYEIDAPSADWLGKTVSVWVAHPMTVPAGQSFEAPASVLVVEAQSARRLR